LLQRTKPAGDLDGGAEETHTGVGEIPDVCNTRITERSNHRRNQQADKKKKKKKKQIQKQKEKLNAKDEEARNLKAMSQEEIRRQELQKAGVLPTVIVSFKGDGKGKVFKGTSNVKAYWTKTSKEPSKLHIKGKSLQILDSENIRDRNQNRAVNSGKEMKGNEVKEWPFRTVHQHIHDNMSTIDSAIAYLSQPEQVLSHLKTNRLLASTNLDDVSQRHDWTESVKHIGLDMDSTDTWSKPSTEWLRNKNIWFGSFGNADQDVEHSRMKPDVWTNIPPVSKSAYREMGRNDLRGIHDFSRPIGKDASEDVLQHFSGTIGKTVPENRLPRNKARPWKETQNNFSNWPGVNPKEERRYFSGNPVYGSPNMGWSRLSVESLKHGNLAGNIKTWPELPIDQDIGSNTDRYGNDETSESWPNFPVETGISVESSIPYSLPKYSDEITNQNSITTGKVDAWSKPSLDPSKFKQKEVTANRWSQMQPSHQKPLSPIDTAIAHHTKEASSSKQWPHFTYHRVTSSPQILAQQQKAAQQRARHRNAYIAVSVISPPGKSKGLNKAQSRTNGSLLPAHNTMNELPTKPSVTPLPDKMDQLLSMRSEKQKYPEGGDLLEEQLVDLAVAGQQQHHDSVVPWSHARHLDKIQVFVSFETVYSFCVLDRNIMRPCL
jgi:hypothetical protein